MINFECNKVNPQIICPSIIDISCSGRRIFRLRYEYSSPCGACSKIRQRKELSAKQPQSLRMFRLLREDWITIYLFICYRKFPHSISCLAIRLRATTNCDVFSLATKTQPNLPFPNCSITQKSSILHIFSSFTCDVLLCEAKPQRTLIINDYNLSQRVKISHLLLGYLQITQWGRGGRTISSSGDSIV